MDLVNGTIDSANYQLSEIFPWYTSVTLDLLFIFHLKSVVKQVMFQCNTDGNTRVTLTPPKEFAIKTIPGYPSRQRAATFFFLSQATVAHVTFSKCYSLPKTSNYITGKNVSLLSHKVLVC